MMLMTKIIHGHKYRISTLPQTKDCCMYEKDDKSNMIDKNDVIVVNTEKNLVYEIADIVLIGESDQSHCMSLI